MYQGMILRCEPTANTTPCRNWDWQAWIDGREENGELYGLGATREEALAELGEKIVERVDDHLHDLKTSGAISEEDAEECFVAIDGLAYLPY